MSNVINQLFFWALNGDYLSLKSALERGVDVNVIDPVTTDSPLMIACRKGHTSIVHLCLHFGAKNDPHPEFGQTALHAAVSERQYGAAQVLLDAAAQSEADHIISNLTDPSGQTPFHVAAYLGAADFCSLLMQHGARLTSIDKQGRTPLHLCAASGNKTCLVLLFDAGGDEMIDIPDNGGNTLLHHAVYHSRLECVRLLLETAADVHARNHQGQTAYNIASSQGHHQIGLLLLDYRDHFSARIGSSNHNSPQTPLKNATSYQHSPSVTPYHTQQQKKQQHHQQQQGQQQRSTHGGFGASPYFHDRFSPVNHNENHSMDFSTYSSNNTGNTASVDGNSNQHAHHIIISNNNNNSSSQQSTRSSSLPPPSPHSQFVLQQPSNAAVALFGLNNGLQHLDSMGNYLPRPHTVNSPMVKGTAGQRSSSNSSSSAPFSPSSAASQGLRSGSNSFDGSIGSSIDDISNNSSAVASVTDPSQINRGVASSLSLSGSGNITGNITGNISDRRVEEGQEVESSGYKVLKRSMSHNAMPKPVSRQTSEPIIGTADPSSEKLPLFEGIQIYTKHSIINSTSNGVTAESQQQQQLRKNRSFSYDVNSVEHKSSGLTPVNSPLMKTPAVASLREAWGEQYISPALNCHDQQQQQQQQLHEDDEVAIEEEPDQYASNYETHEESNYAAPVEEFDLLNRHWSVYYTEDNHVYYLDMHDQHSQWEDPREFGLVLPAEYEQQQQDGSIGEQQQQYQQQQQQQSHISDDFIVTTVTNDCNRTRDNSDNDSDSSAEEPASTVKVRFPNRRLSGVKPLEKTDSFIDNPLRTPSSTSSSSCLNIFNADSPEQQLPPASAATSAGLKNIERIMSAEAEVAAVRLQQQQQQQHSNKQQQQLQQRGQVKMLANDNDQRISTPPRSGTAVFSKSLSHGSIGTPSSKSNYALHHHSPPTTPPKTAMPINISSNSSNSNNNSRPGSANSQSIQLIAYDQKALNPSTDVVSEDDAHRYVEMIRSGRSLREVGEVLEAENRSQHFKLHVLALADEILLESGFLSSSSGSDLDALTATTVAVALVVTESLDDLKTDSTLQKYARMLVMGVAAGNVANKMKIDGVTVEQRNRLMRAVNAPLEAEDSASVGNGTAAISATATAAGGVRKPSLHWETLPIDKVRNSIWSFDSSEAEAATAAAAVSAAAGGSQSGSNLADHDLAELERLFKSVPQSSSFATTRSVGTSNHISSSNNVFQLKLLDKRRAQNISIGLVQFKQFGASHVQLLKGVCSLEDFDGRLTSDHLDNLRSLLPTAVELKRIDVVEGSKHPAEIFFQTAARFYPELPHRLQCFAACLNFGEHSADLVARSKRIIDACNQVLSSSKLAKLLKKMLVVGNVLNEGSQKADAKGIRLDSLLKMVSTKGVDKKTSVLDYVIKSLYEKGEEELLLVTRDLNLVECTSRVSAQEIFKEYENIFGSFALLEESLLHNQQKQQQSERDPVFSSPAAKKMIDEFDVKLNQYMKQYRPQKQRLEKTLRLLHRKIRDLAEYFAEDTVVSPSSSSSSFAAAATAAAAVVAKQGDTVMDIFAVLNELLRAVEFSRAAAEWQIYKIHQPSQT